MRNRARLLRWAAATAAVVTLAGCSGGTPPWTASGPSVRVALLLPHATGERYEAIDLPYFSDRLLQLCPRCTLDYRNAGNDQDVQNQQLKDVLDQGAALLVLDPVKSAAGGALAAQAKQRGVPVISYDRIIMDGSYDYLVSFDHRKVGQAQGQALLDAMGARAGTGEVLWINGPPTDANAVFMAKGAHDVLDGKVKVAAQFTMPGPKWDAWVKEWLAKVLPTIDVTRIVGVYSADDATAGMVGEALAARGVTTMPPITGSNSDAAAVQRVIKGTQYMTTYKPVQKEAQLAAETAFQIISGQRPPAPGSLNNGTADLPAFFVPTEAVTRDRISATLIHDGFLTVNALCSAEYSTYCAKAGITR